MVEEDQIQFSPPPTSNWIQNCRWLFAALDTHSNLLVSQQIVIKEIGVKAIGCRFTKNQKDNKYKKIDL